MFGDHVTESICISYNNNNNVATSALARAPALDGGSREVRFCDAHARGR